MSASLLILATSQSPNCSQVLDKHLDGYYTLQFTTNGAVDLYYDDHYYSIDGPWYWPAYPGPRLRFHAAHAGATWFHRHIGFSGPLLFEWIADGLWPSEPQAAPPGLEDGALLDEVIAQAGRDSEWGRRRATNLFERLLIELAEARASKFSHNEATPLWLQRVVARITSDTRVDYEEVAAGEGMSESTLRRHFRQAMGLSLHQYAIRRRIESARIMLVETELPLKGIADALGYENQYFFSRQFHELVGVAPGVYRRSRMK